MFEQMLQNQREFEKNMDPERQAGALDGNLNACAGAATEMKHNCVGLLRVLEREEYHVLFEHLIVETAKARAILAKCHSKLCHAHAAAAQLKREQAEQAKRIGMDELLAESQ